jgi:hypothetical protein
MNCQPTPEIRIATQTTIGMIHSMSLAELEKEVLKLSSGELSAFTSWLDDYTARSWHDQLERDVAAGKLDRFAAKADEDFETGRCTEFPQSPVHS